MPCPPMLRFNGDSVDKKTEAGEVMSGLLEIVHASKLNSSKEAGCYRAGALQRVFVRIYRTSSEHFLVVFPVRAIVAPCKPLTSFNLKSCSVKPLQGREFRVASRACEGVSITFKAIEGTTEKQMTAWLDAFSDVNNNAPEKRRVTAHRLPLPVLEETEKEDDS